MKRTVKPVVLLLLVWNILPPALPAQSRLYPAHSVEALEASMEANLSWNLENALLAYFPHNKFVVRADVELEKRTPQADLPKLPDALLSRDITNLPGLPYVPDQPSANSAREETADTAQQPAGIVINRIRTTVLVDDAFSEQDRTFIRKLVALISGLDPSRGDRVRVEALPFPVKPEPQEPDQLQQQDEVPASPLQKPAEESALAQSAWFPYFFAAGLAILLVALFLFGLRSIVRHLRPPAGENAENPPAASAHALPAREQEKQRSEAVKQRSELTEMKAATIDAIVGTPAATARVFQQWMQKNGQQGVRDTAIVLAAASPRLLDLLSPYLGPEASGAIQLELDRLDKEEQKERSLALLKLFDQDLRFLALQARRHAEEEDALAFLYQMSDDQLQHLIKPLKPGVKAIVLAQLRPERSAKLLKTMEPEARRSLLASMGGIERIPSDVYRKIARQLAERARELEKMRFVRANGLEALLDILETMDEQEQEETLAWIETQDMDLAQRVRRRFLTFNDFVELPGEKLREYAFAVDRELLAKSLVRVDDEVVGKIISSLPDKLAELVQASIEANQDAPEDDVARARRQVLRAVRENHKPGNQDETRIVS